MGGKSQPILQRKRQELNLLDPEADGLANRSITVLARFHIALHTRIELVSLARQASCDPIASWSKEYPRTLTSVSPPVHLSRYPAESRRLELLTFRPPTGSDRVGLLARYSPRKPALPVELRNLSRDHDWRRTSIWPPGGSRGSRTHNLSHAKRARSRCASDPRTPGCTIHTGST